jgi:uncharacterized membrane protein
LGVRRRACPPEPWRRWALGSIGIVALAALVAQPLVGSPAVLRLPAVLVPALLASIVIVRPWRWTASELHFAAQWVPSRRQLWAGAAILFALLFWIVLTRFRSADINAVDFTVYFDRPCAQTAEGRPLFVESADNLDLAHRSLLQVHAFWSLVPICFLYAVHPSPMWLLALSVIPVGAGAVHVCRIMERLGAGGVLAVATALAFALNDNTARTLNYGFHPEVFYAWLIPWMIDAGLRGARMSFVAATLATVLLKEDAVMPIAGVAVSLALFRYRAMSGRDRLLFLAAPLAIALINLALYFGVIVPRITYGQRPHYSSYWSNYGATPVAALLAMLSRPFAVIGRALTSGFLINVLAPFLFLPAIGWRWFVGVLPIVVLYGAAANAQMRAFGIYYAIILVPFLAIAAGAGALTLTRRVLRTEPRAQLGAAALVLSGALLVGAGSRGYSLRPWKPEVAAVPAAVQLLRGEPLLLVQSGLYPHAGYEERVQLLTRESVEEARRTGAALLISPRVHAYPMNREEIERLLLLPSVGEMPGGLSAVRLVRNAPAAR